MGLNITGLIPKHMENRGKLTLKENLKIIENILEQRKAPENGIDEEHIKLLLRLLSFMDTDKDPNVVQIGEREARFIQNFKGMVFLISAMVLEGVGI